MGTIGLRELIQWTDAQISSVEIKKGILHPKSTKTEIFFGSPQACVPYNYVDVPLDAYYDFDMHFGLKLPSRFSEQVLQIGSAYTTHYYPYENRNISIEQLEQLIEITNKGIPENLHMRVRFHPKAVFEDNISAKDIMLPYGTPSYLCKALGIP
jgi:hypothetical protein